MANNQQKQQQSKQKFGTLTALNDANGDYSSSTTNSKNNANKQQTSKAQYGTLTAKSDANNDYE